MLQFLQPMLSLLPKRKWVSNDATDFCNECCTKIKSGLFSTNKHHCRYCGNIICSMCSQGKYNKHRVCNGCLKSIENHNKYSFNHGHSEYDSDSDIDRIEELSPYNTPLMRYTDTMDEMDIIDLTNIDELNIGSTNVGESNAHSLQCQYNPFSAINDYESGYERVRTTKSLLVYGFVRKYWKNGFNSNQLMRRFPGEYVMDLLIELLSVSDSFDEYYTNLNIIISHKLLSAFKSYRQVQIIERRKEWNTQCYHTFGSDTITKGAKKVWKMKMCGFKNSHNGTVQKPCILIGIVEESKIANFVTSVGRRQSFNDEWNKGYALYTADWNIYHSNTKGRPFANYGIDIRPNDVIAVEVDLTQKYSSKPTQHLCGSLKFIFNGKTHVFENDGIAFDKIDITKSYRLAIGMYLRDKLAMFQVVG